MLSAGIDTIVLGCTHYPFVAAQIAELAGPGVRLIDPAPAVARQARRVLAERGLLRPDAGPGKTNLYTTGDLTAWQARLPLFWQSPAASGALIWRKGELVHAAPARS
jgi:glutamate racemase